MPYTLRLIHNTFNNRLIREGYACTFKVITVVIIRLDKELHVHKFMYMYTCIFTDKPPSSNQDRCRAHISLPQPLHLKATFVDHNKATASFRFEQVQLLLSIYTCISLIIIICIPVALSESVTGFLSGIIHSDGGRQNKCKGVVGVKFGVWSIGVADLPIKGRPPKRSRVSSARVLTVRIQQLPRQQYGETLS